MKLIEIKIGRFFDRNPLLLDAV